MRVVLGRAVAAAAAAAVAAAAAAASVAPAATAGAAAAAAASIPFPSLPPGPVVGRFHTLSALRCWLHPPLSGGASPDPHAVASPAGGGGTGWVLRANDSAPPVFVPYAPGTCAAPLADAEQLEFLAAPAEADIAAPRGRAAILPSTNVTSGGDVAAEYEWAGNLVYASAAIGATLHPPAAGEVASEWFRPHPCGGARRRPGQGLVCEDEVARLLTLHRNQQVGDVKRHAGLFDVLSVTRISAGFALDEGPTVVAAWDVVSSASSTDAPSLLMYTPRTGQTRPVLVGEAALLSLGRGIIADPSWLGGSFPGGLNARVELDHGRRGGGLRTVSWSLGDGAGVANASLWLQLVATVFCKPPLASFVFDSGLCTGVVSPPQSRRTAVTAGGQRVASEIGLGAGGFANELDIWAQWSVVPAAQQSSAPVCPSFDWVGINMTLQQPIWLLGRKSREIHATGPGSEAEVALAGRLSTCAFQTYKDREFRTRAHATTDILVAALSQTYRRDLFKQEPPDDPVTNAELMLAVLVVVPESAGVLLLLLKRRREPQQRLRWSWRRVLVLMLAAVAGGVALVAIGYVDQQERAGHAWRAATVRLETRLPANETESYSRHSAFGRPVVMTESLFIISRTGYRPRLTRKLLAATSALYAVLVLLVLLRLAAAVVWRSQAEHDAIGENGVEGADGRRPRPGKLLASWRRRLARQPRTLGRRWRSRAPAADGPAAAGPPAPVDRAGTLVSTDSVLAVLAVNVAT